MTLDMNTVLTVVISGVVSVLIAAATFFLGVKNLRNQNANGDESISKAWQIIIAPMQSTIASQADEIKSLKARVEALEAKDGASQSVILALNSELKRERAAKDLFRAQLHAHGIEPMDVGVETRT